jgi:hypothetical protein
MRIRVERQDGAVDARLVDTDNFADFAVEVDAAVDIEAACTALGGRIRFTNDQQCWVSEPWLRRLGDYDAAERRRPYEHMLAYARDRGWVDPEGERIAAHVVRTRRD